MLVIDKGAKMFDKDQTDQTLVAQVEQPPQVMQISSKEVPIIAVGSSELVEPGLVIQALQSPASEYK